MKENAAPSQSSTVAVSESAENPKGSPTRKSFIPVPSKSPEKRTGTGERQPLSRLNIITENKIMVGRHSSKSRSCSPVKNSGVKKLDLGVVATPGSKIPSPTCASTPIQALGKERLIKKSFQDKEIQTDHPDLLLITGEEPPPSYWKDLAETRREALEEALMENESLHKRVEELENENKEMEEMVQHAKNLAEIISSITDDSGIATDESNAVDQSGTQQSDDEDDG